MRWFRSHKLKVASLALFALTCQFVLSFGHVHLDRFAGNAANWAVAGKAVAAGALVAPTPPTLLPGILLFKELHWSFATTQAQSIDHIHFNARGPPVA